MMGEGLERKGGGRNSGDLGGGGKKERLRERDN